jgi:hypothetical protein
VHLFVLLYELYTTVTVLGFNFAVEELCNMLIFYEVPGASFSLFCGMHLRVFCCRLCPTNDISRKVLTFTNAVTGETTELRPPTPVIQLVPRIKMRFKCSTYFAR